MSLLKIKDLFNMGEGGICKYFTPHKMYYASAVLSLAVVIYFLVDLVAVEFESSGLSVKQFTFMLITCFAFGTYLANKMEKQIKDKFKKDIVLWLMIK